MSSLSEMGNYCRTLNTGMTWSQLPYNGIPQVTVLTIVCREERWKHKNLSQGDCDNSDET